MKKLITLGVLSLGVIFLAGCGQQQTSQNQSTKKDNTSQQVPVPPSNASQTPAADTTMVDCGEARDPGCFMNRMNGCLPVTTKMVGTDNKTAIGITILGIENEKCHFQRKINNVLDMDCLFPKGTFNENTLGQIFGTDKGLQKVVDDACSKPGF